MATFKKVDGDYTIQTLNSPDAITLDSTLTRTTGAFKVGSYTTSQRDALSPENGWIIYNTTTSTFQGYAGGSWVNLN